MRPTALIRRLLQLELIETEVTQQIRSLRHHLKQQDLAIIDRKVREMDIWIQFRWNNRVHEALFMKSMLTAELPFLMSDQHGENDT